jgi:hypothetical protein
LAAKTILTAAERSETALGSARPGGRSEAKANGADHADRIQGISNRSTINQKPSTPSETFLWDGLALLRRGDTIYINEPHPSGGAVIASFPVGHLAEMTIYLNDMLGTTLAAVQGGKVSFARLSAFGQQLPAASPIAPQLISTPEVSSDLSQNLTTKQTKNPKP